MKCIITVIGRDRVGIIAGITGLLSSLDVNILDISQTIMQEMFTMMMAVETRGDFDELSKKLEIHGDKNSLSVKIQREDIFSAMHRI